MSRTTYVGSIPLFLILMFAVRFAILALISIHWGILVGILCVIGLGISLTPIKNSNGEYDWAKGVAVIIRLVFEFSTVIAAVHAANIHFGYNYGLITAVAYILITFSPILIGDGTKRKRSLS